MSQAHPPVPENQRGRRRHARARLAIPARLTLVSGHMPCTIEDVSESGAQIRVPRDLPLGTRCIIECETECLFGLVVRTGTGRCGIELIDPLSHDTVVALRRLSDNLPDKRRQDIREAAREWVHGAA